jgi:hypothetical protein
MSDGYTGVRDVSMAMVRWKKRFWGLVPRIHLVAVVGKRRRSRTSAKNCEYPKVSPGALFGGETKRSDGGLGAAYMEGGDPSDGTVKGTRHPFRLLRPTDLGALKWGFNALNWTMDECGVTFVFKGWRFGVKNRWNREEKMRPWNTFRSISERECAGGRRPIHLLLGWAGSF